MERIKQEIEDIYAPLFLRLGRMIFERSVNSEVNVVALSDGLGIVQEEEIGTQGRISAGVDGNGLSFERRQELRIEMTRCGVGQPETFGEEFGQHESRGFGLYNRDRLGAGDCPCEEVETEETVLDVPEIEDRAPPFEQFGDPALADVGVEGRHYVVDHPEDGLTGFGLPQVVTLCSVMHLFGGKFAGGDERAEAFEVVNATGVDHRHGRQQEVHLLFDGGCMPLADGFEGVAEDVVPFHRLARGSVD